MKALSVFLNELNEGSTHAALTAEFAALLQHVQATGKAGSLNIAVKVAPAVTGSGAGTDRVVVSVDHTLKLPKAVRPADFFYLSDEGEPVRNHPRQHSLELREAAPAAPLNLKTAS